MPCLDVWHPTTHPLGDRSSWAGQKVQCATVDVESRGVPGVSSRVRRQAADGGNGRKRLQQMASDTNEILDSRLFSLVILARCGSWFLWL